MTIPMMEVKYICPNKKCGRLVLAGTKDPLELGTIVKCLYCKELAVVEDMTYHLGVREFGK